MTSNNPGTAAVVVPFLAATLRISALGVMLLGVMLSLVSGTRLAADFPIQVPAPCPNKEITDDTKDCTVSRLCNLSDGNQTDCEEGEHWKVETFPKTCDADREDWKCNDESRLCSTEVKCVYVTSANTCKPMATQPAALIRYNAYRLIPKKCSGTP